jgi:hypothetical protein
VRAEQGYRLGYITLIALLGALVMSVVTVIKIHSFLLAVPTGGGESPLASALHQLAEQTPVMTLDGDKLVTREPGAKTITLQWGQEGNPFTLITIDTSGAANHETMTTPVLITDKEIYIKTERKTEVHSLNELLEREHAPPLIINRALARDMADGLLIKLDENRTAIAMLLGSILWLALGIWYVIGRLALVFALGICGMVAGALSKRPTTYAQAVRLAAVSFTPIALADALLLIARGHNLSLPTLFVAGSVAVAVAVITTRDTPLAAAS